MRNLLTLMVYYVQCGNDFTLEFGDINEAFYDSLCSMVDQIKKRLLSEGNTELAAEFLPMLEHEFQRIDGQMGWGYPDEVGEQIAELRAYFRRETHSVSCGTAISRNKAYSWVTGTAQMG